MTIATEIDVRHIALTPRRIGHVNLYVQDWLRSLSFYSTVVGLEEVFRESPIKAGFLTAGNTHHDIGFLEAQTEARIGRDRFVQIEAGIGARPEFNHFGIEMENEKELLEGYRRLRALDVRIEKLTNSVGLSKSIYLRDPDGNLLQFYADLTSDWRSFWKQGDRLVTAEWNPESGVAPSETSFYSTSPIQYRALDAAFQPLRVTGGTLFVRDLGVAERFYREIGGFVPVWRSGDGRTILLTAKKLNRDLTIMQPGPTEPIGLRHFSFKMKSLKDLVDGWSRLPRFGLRAHACLDHGLCKSVYIRDPDGFLIEFYADAVEDWSGWLEHGRPWRYPDGDPWNPTVQKL